MKIFIVHLVWDVNRRNYVTTYIGEEEFIKEGKWRINSKSRSKKILLDLIIKSYIDFGFEITIVEGDNLKINQIGPSEKGDEYGKRVITQSQEINRDYKLNKK
jgi:hypothetical protein